MAYNPTVNDNSGQILGEAQRLAKELRAKEQQQMWQGISKGVSNAASGLGEALNDVKAKAIKYDTAAGMLDTYKQNADSLGLDMQMLQGMEQKYSKDPDKLLGALTVVGKLAENKLDIQKAEATYAALGNAYTQKAQVAADAKAALPPKLDANYARQAYQSLRSRNYTHEQAIEGMNAGGMNWGVQYINRPESNPFWGSNP